MLPPKTMATVKATAPILQKNGETLTRHFYKRMFKQNPEVLPLFNPANQAGGTQQQALAAAICAYAANIDNLGALSDSIELIAHKHTSLIIKPEHYPIVGTNLLASIKEVLGEVATDEVIEAWAEAYTLLADTLIAREKELYSAQRNTAGGWSEFKKFTVTKKVKESDVITSFYLKPADGSTPPTFKAGQYITVRVPSPCGHTTMRNYSLSDTPNQDYFRISVKREDGTEGTPNGYVSTLLHSAIEEGHTLEITNPCGDFFLNPADQKTDKPLVLLAGGVGITPVLSMMKQSLALNPQREIIMIQANLHENNQAFRDTLDQLAQDHANVQRHYRYSAPAPDGITRDQQDHVSQGFVDDAFLKQVVPTADADFYFCGPKPFMISVYNSLMQWGTPRDQIHFEFFGPREEIEGVPASETTAA